jgi:putative flippase GtrA
MGESRARVVEADDPSTTLPRQVRMSLFHRSDGAVGQAFRFSVVGVSNTLVSYVVYVVLGIVDLGAAPAAAIAFAAGATNGYLLNRSWTFAARDDRGTRARYGGVQVLGLGLSAALVWLTVDVGGLNRYVGFAISLPLVTVTSFLLTRSWVFQATARNAGN